MLKRIFGETLTDLGNLEGDYRVANLRSDVSQSLLYMSIISVTVLIIIVVDFVLFRDYPNLLRLALLYRATYVLSTLLFGIAMYKTTRVRTFDRLAFFWIAFTVLFFLLFNFTRPVNYLSTSFDIVIPFAIYLLSPLKLKNTILLAAVFSLGAWYIGHFHKTGIDPLVLNVATAAQIIVHVLGILSALQVQTHRRKSFRALIEERDAKEMVAYLANIDPLTKSLTRRQFLGIAESEFRRFQRYHRPLSILILDADHFKEINDTHGHHAGDIVLRSLSLVAMEHKRAPDTFGRLGGEEFGLLMPETSLENARVVAERVRLMWELTPVNLDGEMIRSTMSVGVAEAIPADRSLEDLLRRADRMLYKAKQSGRNLVVSE